uniref:SRSF protein kinase 2 n=1 Tax=Amphilophus citrinellus TaxID=61819 RepID=A0A3Q0SNG8_AMPCI
EEAEEETEAAISTLQRTSRPD